ncbi:transposase [Sphingomonas sp. AAP5]|nr:transposase [Sphingomonas sp. AAP5]
MIQGCLLEAALGERIGVSDQEWALIGPLLPPEHGRGCRPAGDNRRYFEGMMWMARSRPPSQRHGHTLSSDQETRRCARLARCSMTP